MSKSVVRFFNVVLAGIMAGMVFGVWLGCDPKNMSFPGYVEYQQGLIAAFNVLMPVLGLIVILLTALSAVLQREDKGTFIVLLLAIALLILSGLITRFVNQPINAIVMTWKPESPPGDWMALRDRWWSFHIVRTLAIGMSFCLVTASGLRR
ncbi:protein of unknown function [Chryseolinea serpens]|uniref:DUF1772 domain-containing protein n=1 Tax=Chryseolinea serpens TaxID=947013 RepID=A0A1M5M0J6_9BACT|nr:DUF1772 domain-containing protein [Chryseolinea serpens]SHG70827.1 protein of unknown function [Chryseolinea serpens]